MAPSRLAFRVTRCPSRTDSSFHARRRLSGQSRVFTMLQNILIGLIGWAILAIVAGPCIGNVLRYYGPSDNTTPIQNTQKLKKTA
jgi:hypothetical protein